MKTTLTISVALLVLAGSTAFARGPIEDGNELAPRMLTLPSTLDGTVAVQGCPACKRLTYTMSREVRFYVNDQEVTFAAFKAYVGAHPEAVLLLVTPPNQNIVTRLTAQ
jgi:hypothetical protein